MAKLIRLDSKTPRRKKWEHFKLKCRIWLFRTSVLMNLLCVLYFLNQDYDLTNKIKGLIPILESLLTKLPH